MNSISHIPIDSLTTGIKNTHAKKIVELCFEDNYHQIRELIIVAKEDENNPKEQNKYKWGE